MSRAAILDTVEALSNAAGGLVVSVLLTYGALPLWGLTPSLRQSVGITGMFFAASTLRSFVIRRIFRGLA